MSKKKPSKGKKAPKKAPKDAVTTPEVESAESPVVDAEPIEESPVAEVVEETPVAEEAPVAEETPASEETETPSSEDVPVADDTAEIPSEEEASEESAEAGDAEAITGWELSQVVEAILFASQKPVSVKELQSVLKGAAEADKENPAVARFAKVRADDLRDAVEVLEQHSADPRRAYEVRESASGWQLVTKPDYAPWLRQLFPENRPARLSAPAMETLAIIAYRQPITRADLEAVRGVAVDGVMQTLMDRGLVKIAGRAEIPGRPLLYETTQNFMEHFGLKNLDDLPNANELRKVELPKAPVPEAPEKKTDPTPELFQEPSADQPETPTEVTEAPSEPGETSPDSSEAPAESAESPAESADAPTDSGETEEPEPPASESTDEPSKQ